MHAAAQALAGLQADSHAFQAPAPTPLVFSSRSSLQTRTPLNSPNARWGCIFPIGSTATLAARLAAIYNLNFLRALAALFTAADVILWLLVAGMTLRRGWRGQLFYSPSLHEYASVLAAGRRRGVGRGGGSGGGTAGEAPQGGQLGQGEGGGAGWEGEGDDLDVAAVRAASVHLCFDPGLSGLSGPAERLLVQARARGGRGDGSGGGRGGGGGGGGAGNL